MARVTKKWVYFVRVLPFTDIGVKIRVALNESRANFINSPPKEPMHPYLISN